jgi:hypothetical protein
MMGMDAPMIFAIRNCNAFTLRTTVLTMMPARPMAAQTGLVFTRSILVMTVFPVQMMYV